MKIFDSFMSLVGLVLVSVGLVMFIAAVFTSEIEPTVFETAVFVLASGGFTHAVFKGE